MEHARPEPPRRAVLGAFASSIAWAAAAAAVTGSGALLAGCRRHHVPVESEPELPYPVCGDAGVDDPGQSIASGHLRSGPISTEQHVVERFDLRRTSCGYTFRGRQEWPLAVADVEVRYDASLAPIWAWKRLTLPGSTRPDGNADIRRYEMRTGDVFIKRRAATTGETTLEHLLPGGRMKAPEGGRVGAVVTPGRGSITAWLKRARLPVGGKTQDLVLDFRDMVESLEVGSLERLEDESRPDLGGTVRVYTFFGRETVFANADDVVIGDLSGLRPSDLLTTPEPEPLPSYGPPDPVHTP